MPARGFAAPYHFSISPTCGSAFGDAGTCFMWNILHIELKVCYSIGSYIRTLCNRYSILATERTLHAARLTLWSWSSRRSRADKGSEDRIHYILTTETSCRYHQRTERSY